MIAGSGPEEARLRSLARGNPRVSFASPADDGALRALYGRARGLIFPQVEDFGLTPVEAQACGTPVLAFKAGGALESLRPGVNGLFFDAQTPECLAHAVQDFARFSFDSARVAETAKRFAPAVFKAGFIEQLPKELRP